VTPASSESTEKRCAFRFLLLRLQPPPPLVLRLVLRPPAGPVLPLLLPRLLHLRRLLLPRLLLPRRRRRDDTAECAAAVAVAGRRHVGALVDGREEPAGRLGSMLGSFRRRLTASAAAGSGEVTALLLQAREESLLVELEQAHVQREAAERRATALERELAAVGEALVRRDVAQRAAVEAVRCAVERELVDHTECVSLLLAARCRPAWWSCSRSGSRCAWRGEQRRPTPWPAWRSRTRRSRWRCAPSRPARTLRAARRCCLTCCSSRLPHCEALRRRQESRQQNRQQNRPRQQRQHASGGPSGDVRGRRRTPEFLEGAAQRARPTLPHCDRASCAHHSRRSRCTRAHATALRAPLSATQRASPATGAAAALRPRILRASSAACDSARSPARQPQQRQRCSRLHRRVATTRARHAEKRLTAYAAITSSGESRSCPPCRWWRSSSCAPILQARRALSSSKRPARSAWTTPHCCASSTPASLTWVMRSRCCQTTSRGARCSRQGLIWFDMAGFSLIKHCNIKSAKLVLAFIKVI
jgi:hypothetical protein